MSFETYGNLKVYDSWSNPHFKMYKKHGKFPSNLTMGFENEICYDYDNEQNSDFGRKVTNFMICNNYLYMKEEASNCGVEINSHPFNYNWYQELMKVKGEDNFISNLSKLRKNHTFFINNDCGHHIHLSRSFFKKNHLIKMVKFFYSPENTKFLYKISKRKKVYFNCWSSPNIPVRRFMRKPNVPYTFGEIARFSRDKFDEKMGSEENNGEKSAILNLCPRKTIEIRMFKGTTNPVLFKSYLEFALAVSLFTRDTDYEKITIKNFKKYIRKDLKTYKNLNRLITSPRSLKV